MRLKIAFTHLLLLLAAARVFAQEYPEKPVQIVLPLQVGSGRTAVDIVVEHEKGRGLPQPHSEGQRLPADEVA